MKTRQLATLVAQHALWEKFGGRLLRFADEERRLDQDALYQLWAESDSRCWVDTEQLAKASPIPGLPSGAIPVVEDTSAATPMAASDTAQVDFAESSGYGEDLSRFETEIDTWCRRRAPVANAAPAARKGHEVATARPGASH